MNDIWYLRKDGRRERGFINKCVSCGKERIESKSRKKAPVRCVECNSKIRGKDHFNYVDGEKLRWGSELKEIKQKVYDRDGKFCQKCGTQEALELHHIIPWKTDKTKRFCLENLKVYCKKCHLSIERTGKKASMETIEKLKTSHKGYKMPPQQKKKISESMKKYYALRGLL